MSQSGCLSVLLIFKALVVIFFAVYRLTIRPHQTSLLSVPLQENVTFSSHTGAHTGAHTTVLLDNFPLAQIAQSADELPPIPSWNISPSPHIPEATPLFIGFTRNWAMLQQTVVSLITSGWPAEDIHVIENTGTMNANMLGQLSLQNPFFLNHTRLRLFGVKILVTPTLLTFSQLQNFMLWAAINAEHPAYFWSHQDIVLLPNETQSSYLSPYQKAVSDLRATMSNTNPVNSTQGRWAMHFYRYDLLSLVNTAAYFEAGGWDTSIPFYMSDCDMYGRLAMMGFHNEERHIGTIYDVATVLEDLEVLYRQKSSSLPRFWNDGKDPNVATATNLVPQKLNFRHSGGWLEDTRGSEDYSRLKETLGIMDSSKQNSSRGRNTWQSQQSGGLGEPFYRDPWGFEKALSMTMKFGREVFERKWGYPECDLKEKGFGLEDAWKATGDS